MPRLPLRFLAIGLVILLQGTGFAQQTASDSAPARFDTGVFENHTYINECLGFSFPLPAGWLAISQRINGPSKAIHVPGGGLGLLLIEQPKPGTFGNTIQLYALAATDPNVSTRDFVARAVQAQVTRNPVNNQLVRAASEVEYAGKHFFRSDYKSAKPRASVRSLVFTRFRNYYVGEMIDAGSPEEVDSAADSLKKISFREDVPNAKCVAGRDAQSTIAGVISSHPVIPTSPDAKIRVSQMVSGGLLLKKVEPEYPEAALKNHEEGPVSLIAVIDAKGDVEEVRLTSGDPLLAPAAIAAVRQWKYKPYLLEGHPMKMETQISVQFQLPDAKNP